MFQAIFLHPLGPFTKLIAKLTGICNMIIQEMIIMLENNEEDESIIRIIQSERTFQQT